jgi:hypothetical protein
VRPALPVPGEAMHAEQVSTAQRDDATVQLDELRARLYRPGATSEDLRRYEAALRAVGVVPAVAEAAPAVREHRAHGRRTAVLAGALVLAVLTAGAVASRMGASPPALPHATPSPVDDLLHWHPELPVPGVRLADDPAVQQFHGRGAGEARLEGMGLPPSEGRLEVMLTVADSAPVLWTATRVDVGPGSIVTVRVLAEHSGTQRRALPVPVVFFYAGGPPTAVHVQVPNGVAWGLVVAPRR